MSRRKIDPPQAAIISNGLNGVLRNTVAYLKCPVSDDKMREIWHSMVPDDVLDALLVLQENGYDNTGTSANNVQFVVPERAVAVRWRLLGPSGQQFARLPTRGSARARLHQYGITNLPHLGAPLFELALTPSDLSDYLDWEKACADCSAAHVEAGETISMLLKIISTGGQLKRMVPELVPYLPTSIQAGIAEQKNKSPYPDEWAAFPKERIETLLSTLAKGHLFKGMAKRTLDPGFSWAQYTPSVRGGVGTNV